MAAADFTSSTPLWERCLLITRAVLVVDHAAAVVSTSAAGLVSATRCLRTAEGTLAKVDAWASNMLIIYRVAAWVAQSEARVLSAMDRLRSAEANLAEASARVALLMSADAAEAPVVSVLPDGYEIYGGYLHFNGVCTGVMAD